MMVVILPPISLSRAFCTTLSDVLSRADVASSCKNVVIAVYIERCCIPQIMTCTRTHDEDHANLRTQN